MPRNRRLSLLLSPELADLKNRLDSEVENLRINVEGILRDLKCAILDIEQLADDLENEIWDIFSELETGDTPQETPDAT